MYALVDCNNFYVSCERLFNPALEGKPVIVLSNNDGCAISRSEEAKAAGIEMGAIPHLISDIIRRNKVELFSSNYTLYGDISDRVMKTLAEFVPRLEIYSIDEAFLDLHNMAHIDLLELGLKIRRTIKKNIGIPVCIGIAPTKTLAKMANRYAKKKYKEPGVHWAANRALIDEMLEFTGVEDIWGIGRQRAVLLRKNGFNTALQLTKANEEWIRKEMSVAGLRMLNEIKGIPAIALEAGMQPKKNICTGRSFGTLLTDRALIKEALSNFTATAALKLREQNSVARELKVTLNTNQHRHDMAQYFRSVTLQLGTPSNSTSALIKYALKGFDIIFKESYHYKKISVELLDLVAADTIQSNLFSQERNVKSAKAMMALDKVNKEMGTDLVKFGIQGFQKKYKARAAHLSPCYTTNIDHVQKVKK